MSSEFEACCCCCFYCRWLLSTIFIFKVSLEIGGTTFVRSVAQLFGRRNVVVRRSTFSGIEHSATLFSTFPDAKERQLKFDSHELHLTRAAAAEVCGAEK